jgi:hypothetical protein
MHSMISQHSSSIVSLDTNTVVHNDAQAVSSQSDKRVVLARLVARAALPQMRRKFRNGG